MRVLLNLVAMIVAAWVALAYGFDMSRSWGLLPPPAGIVWVGPAILFFGTFWIVEALLSRFAGRSRVRGGGGLLTTTAVRRLVGGSTELALAALAFAASVFTYPYLYAAWSWFFDHLPGLASLKAKASIVDALAFASIFAVTAVLMVTAKPVIARAVVSMRDLWRSRGFGLGGSATFDRLMDEWQMQWRRGQVILGTSLYKTAQRLGRTDQSHLLTVAMTRSGKGRSLVIPNLLTWPGSVCVIDPKGQNAAVTAPARRKMGQAIHIVDPFGMLAKLGLDPSDYPVKRYNPLTFIDTKALDVVEQIRALVEALVVASEYGNPFWDQASNKVLAGIVAHVLFWPNLKDETRHLGTVADYVSGVNGRDWEHLANSEGPGNLAIIAYRLLKTSSGSAGGDIMTTLGVHMQWMDSLAMREAFAASDFDMATVKEAGASLYLVIPPKYLVVHARYLRLFLTMALNASGETVKTKHPMLFLMDEFPALGRVKSIEDAAGVQAGSGVRLWPIVQNLSQLEIYGKNAPVFIANAGQIQVFATNDQETGRYFSERLGQHITWRSQQQGGDIAWMPQGATALLTPNEMARASSRDSGRALVFFEGGRAAIMRRANYDENFRPWQYSPDPWEPRRTWWQRLLALRTWGLRLFRTDAPALPAPDLRAVLDVPDPMISDGGSLEAAHAPQQRQGPGAGHTDAGVPTMDDDDNERWFGAASQAIRLRRHAAERRNQASSNTVAPEERAALLAVAKGEEAAAMELDRRAASDPVPDGGPFTWAEAETVAKWMRESWSSDKNGSTDKADDGTARPAQPGKAMTAKEWAAIELKLYDTIEAGIRRLRRGSSLPWVEPSGASLTLGARALRPG